jgi:SHS2 domain-containing protein
MDKKVKFEFLEHTADVYIASYGETISEAFENAAIAMFEVMTDTKKIEPKLEDTIVVEAEDEQGLLYNWLEALLVNFDTKNRIYSKFKILSFRKEKRFFSLNAKIWGETFNPNKHLQKVGVKAVTYHRMEIIKDQNGVTLEFILDI